MSEVAKQLGYHRRTLTRRFPEISQQISAKYLKYKKNNRILNIQEYCRKVEETVIELHSQGIYPNELKVSQILSKSGNFRDKEVREAFKRARAKIGIR
ncbi:hypothetical protein [Geminocystis sp. GBBB08]|uniref:hypothetical protein n=1 Tax=Geminocystis sp. GBBB08 TaxID=2604140 RepID=UPI0027E29E5C|nr:hypothetical protein [Geminocystis sp. GBBB08]